MYDICLMNPPYYRSLHLKFLERCSVIAKKTVSIQPLTWLQNIFTTKTDKIHPTEVEFLGKVQKVFPTLGGKATYDVGIVSVDNCSETDTDLRYKFIELYEGRFIDPQLLKSVKAKIQEYCIHSNLEDHIKSGVIGKDTKYCIVMPILVGNVGVKTDKFLCKDSKRWGRIFYRGKSEGKTPGEYKKKLRNVKNYSTFDYLEFDTETECRNWIESQYSDIMRFITIINYVDSNRHCRFVPYMDDYSGVWTDDRLAEFFGITEDERRQISEYINLYDKKFHNAEKL